MSSVYGRLGFNSSDPNVSSTISNYSDGVNNQMNLMPQMVNSWQQQDIATSNVGGYFVNPVANVTQTIWNNANTLISLLANTSGTSSAINTALSSVNTYATTISTSAANNFLYITNRQSNVVDMGSDNDTPHYKTAVGIGKLLSYLVYQTDGVQNNSPIMGSFTSITLGNTLNSLSNSFSYWTANIANSITGNTSNISLSNAQTFQNTAKQLANVMVYYPAQDTQFYQNSRNVVTDYSTVAQFSQIGSTESYLLNNYIGTPKITSRLNS
jgi:hypothetical protein